MDQRERSGRIMPAADKNEERLSNGDPDHMKVINASIIISSAIVFSIIGICYYLGYTVVFPHLIDIPIILCAFFHPRRGPAFAIALSALYILMSAVLTGFSEIEILYALGRAAVFIMIGTAVSYVSIKTGNEKKRYSDLFNSLSDITYITSCTEDWEPHLITECNETTLVNTGYSRGELIGKQVSVLASPVPKLKEIRDNGKTESGEYGSIYVFETGHRRKDNTEYPVEMKIRLTTINNKPACLITARDITRRKETEREIINQAAYLESLIRTIPLPFIYKDSDLCYRMCNDPFLEFAGMKNEDFIGKTIHDLLPREFADRIHEMDLETMKTHKPVSGTICLPGNNGEGRPTIMTKMAVFSGDGRFDGIITINQDITDLKSAKEELRRSLEEKTVLLQEVHHRVKNNLAIIIGFLVMQKHHMKDKQCMAALTEAENRIHSLAIVHESIYLSENISEIDAGQHFESLISSILTSFSDGSIITYSIDAGGCKLGIKHAIPASLIVNEIITNSVKYAFKGRESGEISFRLYIDEDETFRMSIADDGVGFPEGFDASGQKTLGMKVINSIVRLQLKGEVSMDSGPKGTTWNIRWK